MRRKPNFQSYLRDHYRNKKPELLRGQVTRKYLRSTEELNLDFGESLPISVLLKWIEQKEKEISGDPDRDLLFAREGFSLVHLTIFTEEQEYVDSLSSKEEIRRVHDLLLEQAEKDGVLKDLKEEWSTRVNKEKLASLKKEVALLEEALGEKESS